MLGKKFFVNHLFLRVLIISAFAWCLPFFICFSETKSISFEEGERVIIFAPHPDDEIIGCAGIIQECLSKKIDVYVVFLTNGDHNQFAFKAYTRRIILNPSDYIKMGQVRKKESTSAAKILGLPLENLIFLGYPDAGTLPIWTKYWNSKQPFENFLTRTRYVPYPDDVSFGNAYLPENIQADLTKILLKIMPSKIFVSHPADLNPDHRALFNFVQLSLLDCRGKINPEVYCYLVHAKNFPKPKGLFPQQTIKIPSEIEKYGTCVNFFLTETQEKNKLVALDCFKSQLIGRKNWTFSFLRKNEVFQIIHPVLFVRNNSSEISIDAQSQEEISEEESLKHTKLYNLRLTYDQQDLVFQFLYDKKVIEKEFGVKIYVYGWKEKIPFSLMPKIAVDIKMDGTFTVYKNEKNISVKDISIKKTQNTFTFKIPYSLLDEPDFIFVGGESKLGLLTLDYFPWKVIDIE